MNFRHNYLVLPLFLVIMGLISCDLPQQAATDSTARIEFGNNEHEKKFGDYVIHVNALTTDQLPADIARTYKITRSKSKTMLNVVITKMIDGAEKPITGTVTTVTRNLANQLKDMAMREIVEQDAIYYISEVSVDNEETLVFYIDVTPVKETAPYYLTYKQQFYTE